MEQQVIEQAYLPAFMKGKTIESVDNSAINSWTIKFTDGTSMEIQSEIMISTSAGSIAGMMALIPNED